jgi:hypothetical protein
VIRFKLVERFAKAVLKLLRDERVGLSDGAARVQGRDDARLLKVFGFAAELLNDLKLISHTYVRTIHLHIPSRTWSHP